jgi:hypothetical protein
MKGAERAAVMFDYRRIALWVVVLLVPGGILLLPLLLADLRRQKDPQPAVTDVPGNDPKTPNDGPGSNPGAPADGTTPRLAA